jgi:SAM-dependent methyltransferase
VGDVYEHPDLVEFFSGHRNAPDDLYPSERRFLVPLAGIARDVLDVGCAAGGFAEIWRAFAPGLPYAGVDTSAALIERARALHPDCAFTVGTTADGLDLPDRAGDVVAALGWLHWDPRWRESLRELWRLTGRWCFFDVRMQVDAPGDVAGRQQLAYLHDWDGEATTPYVAVAWPQLAALLLELGPDLILGHGYWGAPADTVDGVGERVCFATFVLRRGAGDAPAAPRVALDLPLPWPENLSRRVDAVPPDRMEDLL